LNCPKSSTTATSCVRTQVKQQQLSSPAGYVCMTNDENTKESRGLLVVGFRNQRFDQCYFLSYGFQLTRVP
jgi:hypothetical protein